MREQVLELKLLKAFVIVCEELHFGRAARRLNISQPPLSAKIAELEDRLNTRLFVRTSRHVEMTAQAQRLLPLAKKMLASVDSGIAQIHQVCREQQHLKLGLVGSAFWGEPQKLFSLFMQAHPTLQIDLKELNPSQQRQQLANSQIDLGICRLQPDEFPEMAHLCLVREPLVLAVASFQALTQRRVIWLREASFLPFISLPLSQSGFARYLSSMMKQAGFSPPVAEIAEPQSQLALVSMGLGVALIPASYATINWPGVSFLKLKDEPTADLFACWQPSHLTPNVRLFLDFALQQNMTAA